MTREFDPTVMTAADLCNVCKLRGAYTKCCGAPTAYGDGGPDECCGALEYDAACPNCHHQTPAERVVGAFRWLVLREWRTVYTGIQYKLLEIKIRPEQHAELLSLAALDRETER